MSLHSPLHLMSVVGARPQFIKLAALHAALSDFPQFRHSIVHSGQHYDPEMSQAFFDEFHLPAPDVFLQIGSAPHNVQIGKGILALDEVFSSLQPDLVLVYGDTNTTAAAAIAATKRNIPVAHIEAGLREFDKSIPEETNKLIADALADIWFAPTHTAVEQLAKEGKTTNVCFTGDIVIDLLARRYGGVSSEAQKKEIAFLTCHRAVNTDNAERLKSILEAVTNLPMPVIFSVHPRTATAISLHGLDSYLASPRIIVNKPISFWETQQLIRESCCVITDSGGVIKEAYFHQTPCIIIDEQTEWVESVDEGWATVAGAGVKKIINAVMDRKVPLGSSQALGDGKAGYRILQFLNDFFHDQS